MTTPTSTKPVVEFFWRPGCPYCASLDRALRKKHVAVTKRNIWDDPEAAQLVRTAARGNETVPTINIDGTFLVNPSAREVIDLLNASTPTDNAEPTDPTGTTMRALWNGTVIAESDATVEVEGNHYFPIESVNQQHIRPSDTHTRCAWKGTASYFDVVVDDTVKADAAWYYPEPSTAARNIKGHVAFWKGVRVERSTEPPASDGPDVQAAGNRGWTARLRARLTGGTAPDAPVATTSNHGTGLVTDLTDDTFDSALAGGFTLVDFWAPWCGPCKAFHPTFEAIAADQASDHLRFARVNVDNSPKSASRYQVMSIPTLLLLDENGEPVDMAVGAQPRAKVEAMLRNAMNQR